MNSTSGWRPPLLVTDITVICERPMKEQEIAKLLSEGKQAADLVRQGYSRGTVYKVARRLNNGGTTPPAANNVASSSRVEDDPEIIGLKIAIRKAELEAQLGQVDVPVDIVDLVRKMEREINGLTASVAYLHEQLESSPLNGIRREFECPCGSVGAVAVNVECTVCGGETRYGWWPDQNGD